MKLCPIDLNLKLQNKKFIINKGIHFKFFNSLFRVLTTFFGGEADRFNLFSRRVEGFTGLLTASFSGGISTSWLMHIPSFESNSSSKY